MTLEINADSFVCGLYDKLRSLLEVHALVEHTSTGELLHRHDALVVSVSANFAHHGFEQDGNTQHEYGERHVRNYCHFLLCGNVHVWVYTGDEPDPMQVPLDQWANTSNHDSCWRTDGVRSQLSELYFKSCYEVQEHLPERLQKAPVNVTHYCTVGRFLGEGPFAFAEIQFKQDDQNNFEYKLTQVKRSNKTLVLQSPQE